MTRYESLKRLAEMAVQEQPKQDEGVKAEARQRVGAGFATVPEASCYLQVSPRRVREVLKAYEAPLNPAGRVQWTTLWSALWRIQQVPADAYEMMMQPLLTVAEVAERVGVAERSILRDISRPYPRYGLPRHIQLSERARRFHPLMIECWEVQEPIANWMHASAPASRLPQGLRRRR